MAIEDGVAKYNFKLDLSQFTSFGSCPIASVGLKYHIHATWNNGSDSSSFGSSGCRSAITGGHYDPYIACSTASQYFTTECVDLGRVPASGYTYSCTPSLYNNGNYSFCEVGDLSGKFGSINDTGTSLVYESGTLTDYFPPLISNYKYDMTNADMWSSIVFHCGNAAAPRLLCADFSMTTTDACADAFSSFSSDSDDSSSDGLSVGKVVVIAVCCFIVGVLLTIGSAYMYFKSRKSALSSSLNV